jgi:hypothetical protein
LSIISAVIIPLIKHKWVFQSQGKGAKNGCTRLHLRAILALNRVAAMFLNTENLDRCITTLESSLHLLQGASPHSIEYEVFRNAVVKALK